MYYWVIFKALSTHWSSKNYVFDREYFTAIAIVSQFWWNCLYHKNNIGITFWLSCAP